ncbi:kinesin-like protein KIF13A [Babylonia areolata]|uniref:kinesin-like protein KIF13A n=1 Tax=Babylonia areolata TaxID=304850 RepID=UPI003FD5FB1A
MPAGDGTHQNKVFTFDHCFWSIDKNDSDKYADQQKVFDFVGKGVLDQALEGYNGCIFAYGQTGSGKSHTMMGNPSDKGIVPRLCDRLFECIAEKASNGTQCKVEVSYIEIYNEKIRDLLDPAMQKRNLKVLERTSLGVYVDGLKQLAVESFTDMERLMALGNKSRVVHATEMNSESSRSHAVFNIIVTQSLTDTDTEESGEKVSKLSLVDLAGSEKLQKTGAVGERLKEGANINKSLTTLGRVIRMLSEQSAGQGKTTHIPYRESVLTHLLKDNLGGNSKTVMLATISPADNNHAETMSTLRFASCAKRIVNCAVINEDPKYKLICELREEVDRLKKELSLAQNRTKDGGPSEMGEQAPEMEKQLEESEHLIKEMSKTWAEKVAERDRVLKECTEKHKRMGVSVYSVDDPQNSTCPHLISLHADPQLNERLVIYLTGRKRLGQPDAPIIQDIQLDGLGILPEHAIVDVENDEVFITPLQGARTCVNGSVIKDRQKVRHGDRIVWGNNYFFKLHYPASATGGEEQQRQGCDFDMAQQELMEKEFGDDPISEVIRGIEKQHEVEKMEALEKQKQMYEEQMQMLRSQLTSPGTPSSPLQLFDAPRTTPSNTPSNTDIIRQKYQEWMQDRKQNFKSCLTKLKEELVHANSMVREANTLSQEMGKQTEFHVTLQIPAANLRPTRWKGSFISEPAILVRRRNRSSQIWTMEKMENKMVDMREMYNERRSHGLPLMVDSSSDDFDDDAASSDSGPPQAGDPFYESQENHILIGVANIYLECLFYDVTLDYKVPIISQQGDIAGKLHIEISKTGGAILEHLMALSSEENQEDTDAHMGAPLLIKFRIQEAEDLPPALSHFVFCQYSFWNSTEPIALPPDMNPDYPTKQDRGPTKIVFNHEQVFRVPITVEFIEWCREGALSIEVWGNRSPGFGQRLSFSDTAEAKTRSLTDKWNEVRRRMELWVEIQEMNDQGEFTSVQVQPKPEVPSAGVFQLRQGHTRRVLVTVKPVANSGMLPLMCDSIVSMEVGCVTVRSSMFKGLDSYQEVDLDILKSRWFDALDRRKKYLDKQIQKLINKQDKSEADCERERALIDQWVCLTEERNAFLVPSPGSNIPGAPAEWTPPPNVEEHSPVLFLDLNADDMSTPNAKEGSQAAGVHSIVPKEHHTKFVTLPVTKHFDEADKVCAVASWDSSLHEEPSLNRVTSADERIYLVVKVVVRLKYPAHMELVLRKRVAINIYKKQGLSSFTSLLKNRIIGTEPLTSSGIIYEVISNLPKSSEGLEDLETLAQIAASHNEVTEDGENYIEKYIHGISAVESIFVLDRLKQNVKVKEQLSAAKQPSLRKATSLTSINQDSPGKIPSPPGFLLNELRSDSVHDLSAADQLPLKSRQFAASNKPSPLSTGSAKMKPMSTVMEEQLNREIRPLLNTESEEDLDEEEESVPSRPKPSCARQLMEPDTQSIDSDDFTEFKSYQEKEEPTASSKETAGPPAAAPVTCTAITPSSTTDSLTEAPAKGYTPSMTSSGYGSQAVSTLTLSSDDSISVKSMEEPSEGATANSTNAAAAKAASHGVTGNNKRASTGASTDSDAEDGAGSEDKTEALIEESEDEEGEEEEEEGKRAVVSAEEERGVEAVDVEQASEEEVKDTSQDKLALGGDSAQRPPPPTTTTTAQGSETGSSGSSSASTVVETGKAAVVTSAPEADSDPYSLQAMEELERLGEEEEEGEGSNGEAPVSSGGGGVGSGNKPAINVGLSSSFTEGSRTSSSAPLDTSTPQDDRKGGGAKRGSGKKRGSAMRPRPLSMVVSPQAEVMTRAWQDDINCRSSLSLSDHSLTAMDDNMSECSFGSRADLDMLDGGPVPAWLQEGVGVIVLSRPSKTGVVRFIGTTAFAEGQWVGVELDQAEGKNDGSVKGVRYFRCRKNHGIFVRPKKLEADKRQVGGRRGSQHGGRHSSAGLSASLSNLSHSPAGGATASPPSASLTRPTSASAAKKK